MGEVDRAGDGGGWRGLRQSGANESVTHTLARGDRNNQQQYVAAARESTKEGKRKCVD